MISKSKFASIKISEIKMSHTINYTPTFPPLGEVLVRNKRVDFVEYYCCSSSLQETYDHLFVA